MAQSSLNTNLSELLRGHGIAGDEFSLCDFSIAEQNSVAESQGITPSTPSDYRPVLGGNVTYVVACVMINEDNQVLMIQEAKESCAGKWYLPAGRMEKNETIVEAAVREVLEETGLNCRPTTLLAVETAGGSWFRFVLAAEVTGGELKTPDRADQESLQARWVTSMQEVTLRSDDVVPLIERGRAYKRHPSGELWHDNILPSPIAHMRNLLRLVIVIKKRSTNRLNVLLSEKTVLHLPTAEINPCKSLHSTLRRFMVEMFGADVPQHRPHGFLSVEHDSASDGCCLTLLVAFRSPLEEVPLIGKCTWYETPRDFEDRVIAIISSKTSTIALHVVR